MERITDDMPESDKLGHYFRYHLVAGYLLPFERVLDAACGIGYGQKILYQRGPISYFGVDRFINSEAPNMICADLTEWQPDFEFDVFVGFETIEHLSEYENYLDIARQAQRMIFLSAPVVPTRHVNRHHLHDFREGDLNDLIRDENWELIQSVLQPSELSEIAIFRRRD